MSPDRLVGRDLARYHIESLIGSGGMGTVYRARDSRLDRTVALKVLPETRAADESFRQRFLRESKLLASIDHPNIIPVYEADESDGELYIAMRFVDGPDLGELVRQRGALAPALAVSIVGQVADGLDYAHARGLVHRDVKPANILIVEGTAKDSPVHAYLTDFGLTKIVGASQGLTEAGGVVGTSEYIAPEQIQGKAVDHRADVYSLGCVLYDLLTGSVPFPRDSAHASMWAHVNEPPPRPTHSRSDLPSAFDAVISTALAKDPDKRYQTAGGLAHAAREALGSDPAALVVPVAAAARPKRKPAQPTEIRPISDVLAAGAVAAGAAAATGAAPTELRAADPNAGAAPTELRDDLADAETSADAAAVTTAGSKATVLAAGAAATVTGGAATELAVGRPTELAGGRATELGAPSASTVSAGSGSTGGGGGGGGAATGGGPGQPPRRRPGAMPLMAAGIVALLLAGSALAVGTGGFGLASATQTPGIAQRTLEAGLPTPSPSPDLESSGPTDNDVVSPPPSDDPSASPSDVPPTPTPSPSKRPNPPPPPPSPKVATDTDGPTGGRVRINNGAAVTTSTSVTANVTTKPKDPAGIGKIACSKSASTHPAGTTYKSSVKCTITGGADGSRTVYVWFADKKGNWSKTPAHDTITFDNPPVVDNSIVFSPAPGFCDGTHNLDMLNTAPYFATDKDGIGTLTVIRVWTGGSTYPGTFNLSDGIYQNGTKLSLDISNTAGKGDISFTDYFTVRDEHQVMRSGHFVLKLRGC